MTDSLFGEGLAGFTYFWFSLISFEIVISFFYTIDSGGQVRSTFSHHYQSTWRFIAMLVVLAFMYYIGENFLHQPIVNYLNTLQNTLLPLSVLSIAFFAFYSTKVMISRIWRNPVTMATLSISIISFG